MKPYQKEILEVINLGEPICEKIKQIYFPVIPHSACYKAVAAKFDDLKKRARRYYPDMSQKEMLIELIKYSKEDIEEMFHVERDV